MDDEAKRKAQMLGVRLRTYRESAKLGVNQLAEYSGVSASYISRLERGMVPRPSAPTLQKLAIKLNVTLPDLMGTTNSETDIDLEDPEMDLLFRQVKTADLPDGDKEYLKDFMRLALKRRRDYLADHPEQ